MVEKKTPKVVKFSLSLISLFLVIWVLIIGKTIIIPFVIALFLTFTYDPIINKLTQWRVPRGLAVLLTMLLSVLLLYLMGMLIYSSAQAFVEQFPKYEQRMMVLLKDVVSSIEGIIGENLNADYLKNINWLDTLREFSIASNLVSGIGNFFNFFGKTLIVIIFMAYMLMGKPNLDSKINKAFPEEKARRINEMLEAATLKIQKYLSTKLLVSTITSLLSLTIFLIFDLDFPIFWAVVIFVLNFIPNIGSIIASVLPVLFSILQFGSIYEALWLFIAIGIVQFIMGNVLEPRWMGYTLNLSPLVVILSLIFWGYIWGIAGMLLSVPILATLTIVTERIEPLKSISVFLRGHAN